jgi:hypothetical protein
MNNKRFLGFFASALAALNTPNQVQELSTKRLDYLEANFGKVFCRSSKVNKDKESSYFGVNKKARKALRHQASHTIVGGKWATYFRNKSIQQNLTGVK